MRFYLAEVEEQNSKWFTSRREAKKWANREFSEYKKWHDEKVREEHEYHVPRNSHLFARKKWTSPLDGRIIHAITITPVDVPTDKQGLLRFLNSNWPNY